MTQRCRKCDYVGTQRPVYVASTNVCGYEGGERLKYTCVHCGYVRFEACADAEAKP